MRYESTKKRQTLAVEYTNKALSGWGGFVPFARFMDAIGVREILGLALPDGRTSNNKVPVVDLVVQFLISVLQGGRRFEHVERVRHDEVIRAIFGIDRFGSASTLTRYLSNFLPGQTQHLSETLSAGMFEIMSRKVTHDVLDLDSTVFTRYGKQEGSTKGYNPKRRGARSHQPLLAMASQTKLILHAWLRAGTASPHKGCQEFMEELLARLPKSFRIDAVRTDSGFYSRDFMSFLEEKKLPYAITVKMSRGFRSWCASLDSDSWTRVSKNEEITEGWYKAPKASKSRRMIVWRECVHRDDQDTLFPIIKYEYHAIATSLSDSPIEVWNFHKKRGDCENRIKELKYDFNADGFCLDHFHGTEAALLLNCFLFNVVTLFKLTALKITNTTLGTIRTKLFVVGASLGSSGRTKILRLGLQGPWKQGFDKLLDSVAQCSISTAAQLIELLANPVLTNASAWHMRRRPLRGTWFY